MPDALIDEAARRFGLLSDSTRLRILSELMETGPMTVTQIGEALGLSAPNVSQHLARLLSAGMVDRRRDGRNLHYSVVDPTLRDLCGLVCSSLRGQAERLLADRAASA